MRVIFVSKSEFGCGNFHTINRIIKGIKRIEPNIFADFFDHKYSNLDYDDSQDALDFFVGLNIFRSSFLAKYVRPPSKLVLICGGTDLNADVCFAEKLRQMSEAVQKSCAIVVFCPSLRKAFLKQWPNYPGLIREIPQSVTVDRDAAIRDQQSVLIDVERRLATRLDSFIVFVGRLRPIKDPNFIFQPFLNWLAKQGENASKYSLLYIGSIEEHCEEVERLIKNIQRSKSVFWVESLPQAHVHALMTAAECFVNSSLSEGQSLAVMEALALGCPTLVRNIPGNNYLVEHNETGLVFETQQDFVECLEMITRDDGRLRSRLSYNAVEKMRSSQFKLESEASAYLNLFRELSPSSSSSCSGNV